jgi:hypothetical protein
MPVELQGPCLISAMLSVPDWASPLTAEPGASHLGASMLDNGLRGVGSARGGGA